MTTICNRELSVDVVLVLITGNSRSRLAVENRKKEVSHKLSYISLHKSCVSTVHNFMLKPNSMNELAQPRKKKINGNASATFYKEI